MGSLLQELDPLLMEINWRLSFLDKTDDVKKAFRNEAYSKAFAREKLNWQEVYSLLTDTDDDNVYDQLTKNLKFCQDLGNRAKGHLQGNLTKILQRREFNHLPEDVKIHFAGIMQVDQRSNKVKNSAKIIQNFMHKNVRDVYKDKSTFDDGEYQFRILQSALDDMPSRTSLLEKDLIRLGQAAKNAEAFIDLLLPGYFDDNATWVLENHVFPTWAKQSQEESGEIHDESRTKELIQTLREKWRCTLVRAYDSKSRNLLRMVRCDYMTYSWKRSILQG